MQKVKMSKPILIQENSCDYLDQSAPIIYMKNAYNPLLLRVQQSSSYQEKTMANNFLIDLNSKLILVNGANGSGKTTMLRMLALITILA